jgi:hypothetical protein
MPVPDFTHSGVLPAFTAGNPAIRNGQSPYHVTLEELVRTLGFSSERQQMIQGLVQYRAFLRSFNLRRGFQWVDGSFVERKAPHDIDTLTFFYANECGDLSRLWGIGSDQLKATFHCDGYYVALDEDPEALVELIGYWTNLFSHRRDTFEWKGMLRLDLSISPFEQQLLGETGAAQ